MNRHLKILSFSSPFLVTVEKEASISEILELMEESDIRHLPVVENDVPIGVISERDLRIFENREFAEKFCAKDIMIEKPFTAQEDADLLDVIKQMEDQKYGCCLIEKPDGRVTGIFTMIDALRTLKTLLEKGKQPKTISIERS